MARTCGDCQLCCRLLPTPEIDKRDNERCRHQKHGCGCRIYATRPLSCQLWSCLWLSDPDTHDIARPDRSHLVLDMIPDYVTSQPHDGSAPTHFPVVQVWCDPDYPDAHRAPAFRAWLERKGQPAVIRYSGKDAFVLFPPAMTGGAGWIEHRSSTSESAHTLEDKVRALGGSLVIELAADDDSPARATLTVDGRQITMAAGPR